MAPMPGHFIEAMNTAEIPEFTPTPRGQDDFRTKHKTEMCKKWELGQICDFKDKCSFAHGHKELKRRQDYH
jgi:hypothetical protein